MNTVTLLKFADHRPITVYGKTVPSHKLWDLLHLFSRKSRLATDINCAAEKWFNPCYFTVSKLLKCVYWRPKLKSALCLVQKCLHAANLRFLSKPLDLFYKQRECQNVLYRHECIIIIMFCRLWQSIDLWKHVSLKGCTLYNFILLRCHLFLDMSSILRRHKLTTLQVSYIRFSARYARRQKYHRSIQCNNIS
jgi:hypothetical protein